MLSNIGIYLSLCVPILLTGAFWFNHPRSWGEWGCQSSVLITSASTFYLIGRWDYVGEVWKLVSLGAVALPIVRGLVFVRKMDAGDGSSRPGKHASLFGYILPTLVFLVMSLLALFGRSQPAATVALAFPLKEGNFYLAQAGSSSIVNAHHPHGAQTFALDIVALNPSGRHAHVWNPTALGDYVIFGQPVYSPCNGIVTEVVDRLEDITPGTPGDTQNAAGNHLYIACQEVEILLAHLKQGSVLVENNQQVKIGELLGQVGNSGNTVEPHLHIHAQTGRIPGSLTQGTGIAILFDKRFGVRNDIVQR